MRIPTQHTRICLFTAIAFLTVLLIPAQAEAQRSNYWKQRVSLFNMLPIDSNDIVFLGNSITDGGEWCELFKSKNVKNRGISGDVIPGVRERLEQVVRGKPKKIFLLIGINDVSHNLTAEQITRQYEELVKEIREKSPKTKLYIQSVMPIDNDFKIYKNLFGREDVVPQINAELPDIAKRNGAVWIDLWPALADPQTGKLKKELTNDGLHLTGKGYETWAEVIKKYVEN